MIPTQSQPGAKRKLALDDSNSNPLLAAAKKMKNEHTKGASNKRKLQKGADGNGGLLIVHAPEPYSKSKGQQQPSSRHASQPPPDRPPSSQSSHRLIPAGPTSFSQPNLQGQPSKKFRAGSQPLPSETQTHASSSREPTSRTRISSIPEETLEQDVRAMEDEADRLRRESRARQVDLSLRPAGHAVVPDVETAGGKNHQNGTTRKGKKKEISHIIDTTQQIPTEESPMIARNKTLRQGAMAAIRSSNEASQEEDRRRSSNSGEGSSEMKGHRRKNSVSRGKRISASFEASGSFTEPHKSVTHKSFYKHIDVDLPESERLRQLLIWCHSRTAQDPFTFASSDSSPELPDLSSIAHLVLKDVWKNSLQTLADKQIDLNPYSSSPSSSKQQGASAPKLQENEQNMSLRRWETEYSADIRKMEEESEAWNKVEAFYDSFIKKERARIDHRKTDLETLSRLSAKAQGKQKADGEQEMLDDDLNCLPSLDLLPESQRDVVGLCKSLLRIQTAKGGVIDPGAASRREKYQAEEKLKERFRELEYNLDQLHCYVNTARAATRVAESLLDKRFEVLSMALKARTGDSSLFSSSSFGGSSCSAAQVLKDYLPSDSSRTRTHLQRNPQEIFKALAHVDSQRPPGKRGDEVRRAERVLQRIGEAGGGGVGERRLTIPPLPGPQTPRKAPGTPKRGPTPGKDRTPVRERTPGGDR